MPIRSICHKVILLTTSSALSFIIYTCRTILGGIGTNILLTGTPETGLFGTDTLEMVTTDSVGDTTSSGKRQRSAGGSPSKNSKKKKEKGTFICPICLENIVEATKTRQGQDSIFCEGSCSTWLHRKCAGLSRTAFIKIDKNLPYVCTHCKLQTQENEIKSLKNTVDMFIKTVDELKVKLEPLAISKNTFQPADLINLGHLASNNSVAHNTTPTDKVSQVDRKSNIVVFRIKECPKGTSKLDRFKQDIDSVADLLHTVDPDFHKQSKQDSFRLGKFKANATRPRSILVKFHRQLDAISILSNKTSLPNGIITRQMLAASWGEPE